MKKKDIIWNYSLGTMVVFLLFLSISFKGIAQESTELITDIDGNAYKTIKIGMQTWMAENLKTTKYNDSTAIPLVTDNIAWGLLTTPAYCYYGNDIANKNVNGGLYNWYTINTNLLCPTGWHVPTDAEWSTLTDYLTKNGYGFGGSGIHIAKSMANTVGWIASRKSGTIGKDQASNNRSGFAALASGIRSQSGAFSYIGSDGMWWSSTKHSTVAKYAWLRSMNYNTGDVGSLGLNMLNGFSVRCLKNK